MDERWGVAAAWCLRYDERALTQARPPGRSPEAPEAPAPPGAPVAIRGSEAGPGTPLQYLKGVGPQRARLLERIGLQTVADALDRFPRRYEDRREVVPFRKLRVGE